MGGCFHTLVSTHDKFYCTKGKYTEVNGNRLHEMCKCALKYKIFLNLLIFSSRSCLLLKLHVISPEQIVSLEEFLVLFITVGSMLNVAFIVQEKH